MVPHGEIYTFIEAVGHSPREGKTASLDILKLLTIDFESETMDLGDGQPSTYWSFYEAGAVLTWKRQILLSTELYVQGDPDNGFNPYPRRLFESFGNDATRAEIEARLGVPDTTGQWNGEWIRYDNVNETELRFEFDENNRLWSVGVTMKGWQDF